jgi:HlyD family secretion protein
MALSWKARKWVVPSVVAAVVVIGMVVAGSRRTAVDYYTIRRRTIDYRVLASCTVKHPAPLDLTVSAPGRVSAVSAVAGGEVRAGTVLVRLDDETERRTVEIASAALAGTRLKVRNARQETLPKLRERLNQAQNELDTVSAELERLRRLLESGAVARVEVQNAENRYQRALSERNQLRISLETMETSGILAELLEQERVQLAQLELARAALEDRRVKAPVSGVVSAVHVQRGQRVAAGTPVVTMVERGPWVLEADVDQKELPYLTPGTTAMVAFDAYPDDRVRARVSFVCALVDVGKGTCDLKLEVVDPRPYIRYGMSGTAEIEAGRYEDVTAVPSRFVVRSDGRAVVGVWDGRRVVRREVSVVPIGERWMIVRDIPEGTRVLLPVKGSSARAVPGIEAAE